MSQPSLIEIEQACRKIGGNIVKEMVPGSGFILIITTFGGSGHATYISTCQRADTVKLMREMAHKIEADPVGILAGKVPVPPLDQEKHRARHVELHKMLDELAADWISHNPKKTLSKSSIMEFMKWSHQQTITPDEISKG